MPSFLGRLLGLNFRTERLIMNLLGLVNSTLDWSSIKWTNKLEQIWNLSLSQGTLILDIIGEDTIKTVLSWIVITRIVLAHVYTFTYLSNIYSILTWSRPNLLLPWLVLSFFKNIVLEVVVIGVGLLLWYDKRYSLPIFLEFVFAKVVPLFYFSYNWYSNSCLFLELHHTEKLRKLRSDSHLIATRLCLRLADSKYRTRSLTTLISYESYETYDSQDTMSRIIDDPRLTPAQKTMRILGLTDQDVDEARTRIREREVRRRLTELEDESFLNVRQGGPRFFSFIGEFDWGMRKALRDIRNRMTKKEATREEATRDEGTSKDDVLIEEIYESHEETVEEWKTAEALEDIDNDRVATNSEHANENFSSNNPTNPTSSKSSLSRFENPENSYQGNSSEEANAFVEQRSSSSKKRSVSDSSEAMKAKQLKLCSSDDSNDFERKSACSLNKRDASRISCPKHAKKSVEKSCSPVKLQALLNCNCIVDDLSLKENEYCWSSNATMRTSTPNASPSKDKMLEDCTDSVNTTENLCTNGDGNNSNEDEGFVKNCSFPLMELLKNDLDILTDVKRDDERFESNLEAKLYAPQCSTAVGVQNLSEIVKDLSVSRNVITNLEALKAEEGGGKLRTEINEIPSTIVSISVAGSKNSSSPLMAKNVEKVNLPEYSFGDANIPRFYKDSMKVFDGCYEKDFANNTELQCLLRQLEKKKWNIFSGQPGQEMLMPSALSKQDERGNRSTAVQNLRIAPLATDFETMNRYEVSSSSKANYEHLVPQIVQLSNEAAFIATITKPSSTSPTKDAYTQTTDDHRQISSISVTESKKNKKTYLKRAHTKEQLVNSSNFATLHHLKSESGNSLVKESSKPPARPKSSKLNDHHKKSPHSTKSPSDKDVCECKADCKPSNSSELKSERREENRRSSAKCKVVTFGTIPLSQVVRPSMFDAVVYRRKPPVYPKKARELPLQDSVSKKSCSIKKLVEASKRSPDKQSLQTSKRFKWKNGTESLEEREAREMRALKAYNEVTLLRDKKELESRKKMPSRKNSLDLPAEYPRNRSQSRKTLDKFKKDPQNADPGKENRFADATTETEPLLPASREIKAFSSAAAKLVSLSNEKYACSKLSKINKATDKLLENFDRLHGGQTKQDSKKNKQNADAEGRKQYTRYSKPKKFVDEENASIVSIKKLEGAQTGRELERTPAKEDVTGRMIVSKPSSIRSGLDKVDSHGRGTYERIVEDLLANDYDEHASGSIISISEDRDEQNDGVLTTVKCTVFREIASSWSSSTVDQTDELQLPAQDELNITIQVQTPLEVEDCKTKDAPTLKMRDYVAKIPTTLEAADLKEEFEAIQVVAENEEETEESTVSLDNTTIRSLLTKSSTLGEQLELEDRVKIGEARNGQVSKVPSDEPAGISKVSSNESTIIPKELPSKSARIPTTLSNECTTISEELPNRSANIAEELRNEPTIIPKRLPSESTIIPRELPNKSRRSAEGLSNESTIIPKVLPKESPVVPKSSPIIPKGLPNDSTIIPRELTNKSRRSAEELSNESTIISKELLKESTIIPKRLLNESTTIPQELPNKSRRSAEGLSNESEAIIPKELPNESTIPRELANKSRRISEELPSESTMIPKESANDSTAIPRESANKSRIADGLPSESTVIPKEFPIVSEESSTDRRPISRIPSSTVPRNISRDIDISYVPNGIILSNSSAPLGSQLRLSSAFNDDTIRTLREAFSSRSANADFDLSGEIPSMRDILRTSYAGPPIDDYIFEPSRGSDARMEELPPLPGDQSNFAHAILATIRQLQNFEQASRDEDPYDLLIASVDRDGLPITFEVEAVERFDEDDEDESEMASEIGINDVLSLIRILRGLNGRGVVELESIADRNENDEEAVELIEEEEEEFEESEETSLDEERLLRFIKEDICTNIEFPILIRWQDLMPEASNAICSASSSRQEPEEFDLGYLRAEASKINLFSMVDEASDEETEEEEDNEDEEIFLREIIEQQRWSEDAMGSEWLIKLRNDDESEEDSIEEIVKEKQCSDEVKKGDKNEKLSIEEIVRKEEGKEEVFIRDITKQMLCSEKVKKGDKSEKLSTEEIARKEERSEGTKKSKGIPQLRKSNRNEEVFVEEIARDEQQCGKEIKKSEGLMQLHKIREPVFTGRFSSRQLVTVDAREDEGGSLEALEDGEAGCSKTETPAKSYTFTNLLKNFMGYMKIFSEPERVGTSGFKDSVLNEEQESLREEEIGEEKCINVEEMDGSSRSVVIEEIIDTEDDEDSEEEVEEIAKLQEDKFEDVEGFQSSFPEKISKQVEAVYEFSQVETGYESKEARVTSKSKEVDGIFKFKETGETSNSKEIEGIFESKDVDGTREFKRLEEAHKSKEAEEIPKSTNIKATRESKEFDTISESKEVAGISESKTFAKISKSNEAEEIPKSKEIDGIYESEVVEETHKSKEAEDIRKFANVEAITEFNNVAKISESKEAKITSESKEVERIYKPENPKEIPESKQLDPIYNSTEVNRILKSKTAEEISESKEVETMFEPKGIEQNIVQRLLEENTKSSEIESSINLTETEKALKNLDPIELENERNDKAQIFESKERSNDFTDKTIRTSNDASELAAENRLLQLEEEISLRIIVTFWFLVFFFYVRYFYQKIFSFKEISTSTSTLKPFEIHAVPTSTTTLLQNSMLVEKITEEKEVDDVETTEEEEEEENDSLERIIDLEVIEISCSSEYHSLLNLDATEYASFSNTAADYEDSSKETEESTKLSTLSGSKHKTEILSAMFDDNSDTNECNTASHIEEEMNSGRFGRDASLQYKFSSPNTNYSRSNVGNKSEQIELDKGSSVSSPIKPKFSSPFETEFPSTRTNYGRSNTGNIELHKRASLLDFKEGEKEEKEMNLGSFRKDAFLQFKFSSPIKTEFSSPISDNGRSNVENKSGEIELDKNSSISSPLKPKFSSPIEIEFSSPIANISRSNIENKSEETKLDKGSSISSRIKPKFSTPIKPEFSFSISNNGRSNIENTLGEIELEKYSSISSPIKPESSSPIFNYSRSNIENKSQVIELSKHSSISNPEERRLMELRLAEEEIDAFRYKEDDDSSSSKSLPILDEETKILSDNLQSSFYATVQIEEEIPKRKELAQQERKSRKLNATFSIEEDKFCEHSKEKTASVIDRANNSEEINSSEPRMEEAEVSNSMEILQTPVQMGESFDSVYTKLSEGSKNDIPIADLGESSIEEFAMASNESLKHS